ncbi:MAG: hypothetical protein WCA27_32155 [Candidatus Sulfotelmatobacter sp.]
MNWPIDSATQIAAHSFPLPIYASQPLPEYQGGNFDYPSWVGHLRPGDVFPPKPAACYPNHPGQIVAEFQAAHYLSALALTASWGGMGRTKKYIYGHPPQHIHNVLDQCVHSIRATQSAQYSWDLLVGGLRWTSVMASKTLYFLCRGLFGLGYQDPPVPIDGAVIRGYVWPGFRIGIPPAQRPQDWSGDSFVAYCRYMTAIIEWAQLRSWTTTQVQATIFEENKP